MTLLVRDEQDIISTNIEYHLTQGVDFFVVTDNRSEDETAQILGRYEAAGLLHYSFEAADDYSQHAWVTRMARAAYTQYGADWVINNDADEFWWPLEGNLKEVFEHLPMDVNLVEADRHNFVAVPDSPEPFWSRMVYRQRVSLNALGMPLPSKVAHRGADHVTVGQGNHFVTGFETPKAVLAPIEILHFPVRSNTQIENKIVKGGRAYARNQELPAAVGATWRKLYGEYQREQSLERYFKECYYDATRLASGLRSGEIVEDQRLARYLARQASPVVPQA